MVSAEELGDLRGAPPLGSGLAAGDGCVESLGIGISDGSTVGVISGVGSLLVVGAGDIAEVGEELSSAITGATRVSIAPKEQSAMNRLARTFDLPEAM